MILSESECVAATLRGLAQLTQVYSSEFGDLLNRLKNLGDVGLTGGSIRDWSLGRFPRDIDLAVATSATILRDSIESSEYLIGRTSFGGYRLKIDAILCDVWALEDTWSIKQQSSFLVSFDSLVRTAFFNADAVVFNVHTGELHEYGFLEAMEQRMLDIVNEQNPFPHICAARALVFKQNYQMRWSKRVREFVRKWTEEDLVAAQIEHYGCALVSAEKTREYLASGAD